MANNTATAGELNGLLTGIRSAIPRTGETIMPLFPWLNRKTHATDPPPNVVPQPPTVPQHENTSNPIPSSDTANSSGPTSRPADYVPPSVSAIPSYDSKPDRARESTPAPKQPPALLTPTPLPQNQALVAPGVVGTSSQRHRHRLDPRNGIAEGYGLLQGLSSRPTDFADSRPSQICRFRPAYPFSRRLRSARSRHSAAGAGKTARSESQFPRRHFPPTMPWTLNLSQLHSPHGRHLVPRHAGHEGHPASELTRVGPFVPRPPPRPRRARRCHRPSHRRRNRRRPRVTWLRGRLNFIPRPPTSGNRSKTRLRPDPTPDSPASYSPNTRPSTCPADCLETNYPDTTPDTKLYRHCPAAAKPTTPQTRGFREASHRPDIKPLRIRRTLPWPEDDMPESSLT